MATVKQREPLIALLASLLTPGLGQIYNGQLWKGILLLLAALFVGMLTDIFRLSSSFQGAVFEFLAALIFVICVMVDAFRTAKRIGQIELRNYQRWYVYVGLFLIVILIHMIPYFKTYKTYKMPSASMEPSMQVGERFVADLKVYRKKSPQRGDVVIFEYPNDRKKDFVKRVIGLPSEKIEIRNKQVFVNDQILHEAYIQHSDDYIIMSSVAPRDNIGPFVIPLNCFFVMGDNRDNSYDSRFFNCVDADLLIAKVLYVYWSEDFNRIGLQF